MSRHARVRVLWTVGIVAVLGIVWLITGRQLTLLLDRVYTVRVTSLSLPSLYYQSAALKLSGAPEGSELGRLLFDLPVRFEGDRALIDVGERAFPLGTRTTRNDSDGPVEEIATDAGDDARFTVERSVFGWATPFELNFMTGHSPSFKRHVYYRFSWKKAGGQQLEMVWRYEQWYYSDLGWSGLGGQTREGSTGLIRKTIRP